MMNGYNLVVKCASYHARGPELNSHWQPIFDSRFYEIYVQRQWGIKFCGPGRGLHTVGLSSITFRMAYLLAFQV